MLFGAKPTLFFGNIDRAEVRGTTDHHTFNRDAASFLTRRDNQKKLGQSVQAAPNRKLQKPIETMNIGGSIIWKNMVSQNMALDVAHRNMANKA